MRRQGKTFVLDYGNEERTVSIDCLKPAFTLAMEVEHTSQTLSQQPLSPEAEPFIPTRLTSPPSQPPSTLSPQCYPASSPPTTPLRGILQTPSSSSNLERQALFDELPNSSGAEPTKRPYVKKVYLPRSMYQGTETRLGRSVRPPL